MNRITIDDVLQEMKPLWGAKTETVSRLFWRVPRLTAEGGSGAETRLLDCERRTLAGAGCYHDCEAQSSLTASQRRG